MYFYTSKPSYHAARGNYSRKQQVLLSVLGILLLHTAAQADTTLFVTDADMGIFTYDSIVEISKQPFDVRVQLRFICQQQQASSSMQSAGAGDSSQQGGATVEGFVSAFPVNNVPPPWSPTAPHYMAPNIRHVLDISILSRDGSSMPLPWVGPKDYGLWHVRTQLDPSAGPFQLAVGGSAVVHDLPQPLCEQQQRPGTPDFAGGIWNVLTTTSNSSVDPNTLAFAVLEHNAYHRSMGFSGTILRSNIDESRVLIRLREVQKAVREQGLIIWPWEFEHVAAWATHYWQKPKNQLTLLGVYRRDAKLAFFDLDEYLVLPGGTTVKEAQCFGQPLLYPGEDGRMGSWVFIRYQAKICVDSNADLTCWEAGAAPSKEGAIEVLHDLCPMSYGHGKHILAADMVDTVSVHFTWSEHFEGNHLVNNTCGYLLHFYSLLGGRTRALVTGSLKKIPPVSWRVDPQLGRRVVAWPDGLEPLSFSACTGSPAARGQAVAKFKAHKGKKPAVGHQHGSVKKPS